MRIYEYGRADQEGIVLVHPSLVTWDYFEYLIPLLEKQYHLLIPALHHGRRNHALPAAVDPDPLYRAA